MLFGFAALSLAITGCSREDDAAFNARSAKISAEIDMLADDVSAIAEEQYSDQEAASGRAADAQALLPSCAVVTTSFTDDTWTSIVDFGDAGCALANGNVVTGEIIVSGSTDFGQAAYEVGYTFSNFYHNGRQVEGTRHVTFTRESTAAQPELHTVANIDLDFTVTYPNGNAYHRTGHRVRELIGGYDTPFNWTDNTYQVTGQWATVFASGTLNTSIGNPLVYNVQCGYIASGTLLFTSGSDSALLDYGNGLCDWFATLTINGGNETTVLLN